MIPMVVPGGSSPGTRGHWPKRAAAGAILTTLAATLLIVGACGTSHNSSPVTTPSGGAPLTPLATATATATAPAGTPTPAPTPAPSSTPTSQAADAQAGAYEAALAILDAVPVADCQSNNPDNKLCLNWSTMPSTPQYGVAAFNVGSPGAGASLYVFGLEQDGATWGRWFSTQQQLYQAIALPAHMIVCAFGNGLNVRSGPKSSASIVRTLPDLTGVQAVQFVLTTPQASATGAPPGAGWYRISSPVAGWAAASDLSLASLGSCALHDALVNG